MCRWYDEDNEVYAADPRYVQRFCNAVQTVLSMAFCHGVQLPAADS